MKTFILIKTMQSVRHAQIFQDALNVLKAQLAQDA